MMRVLYYVGAGWSVLLAVGLTVVAITGLRRLGPPRVLVLGLVVGLLVAIAMAMWRRARRPMPDPDDRYAGRRGSAPPARR